MEKTSLDQNSLSGQLRTPQSVSPQASGSISSEVKHLIWTTSYLQSAILQSMKKGRLTLEKHTFYSPPINPNVKSNLPAIGQPPGEEHLIESCSPSCTGHLNSENMQTTYMPSLTPGSYQPISELSCMISPYETTCVGDRLLYSPTAQSLHTCTPPSLPPMGSSSPQ